MKKKLLISASAVSTIFVLTFSAPVAFAAVPTNITWANPADITYGTPLSGDQLNAVVDDGVAGTLTYAQPVGTILNAGPSQTLHVDFVPDDSQAFDPSGADVQINVAKASATINVTPYSVVFDGTTHSAAGSATGVLGESLSGLDFSATAHTSTGTTTDAWAYTDITGNYNDSSGSVQDIIAQAPSVTTITCSPSTKVYTSFVLRPCTVLITGAGGLSIGNQSFNINYSANTNVGTSTASFTYAGDADHLGSSGTKNFTITPATATVSVNGYTGAYDAVAHGASVASAVGVGLDTDLTSSVDLGSPFTNVPGGTANWTFSNANYNTITGTASVVINVDPNSSLSVIATSTGPGNTIVGTITNSVTSATTSPIGNVDVALPANLTITGPAGWDGTITMPTATTTTVVPPIDSGNTANTATSSVSIEIGFGDTNLTFDKGVRIFFTGQAGKQIGYSHGAGTFTKITRVCSADNQTVGDALASGSDCKIDVGSDLIVWTKHFSTFTAFTTTLVAPIMTPNGAVFHGTQNVTMNEVSGTVIHYTLDGSTPTCSSTAYAGETFSFSTQTVVKTLRCDPTGVSLTSSVSSANFSPATGNVDGGGGGGGGSVSITPTVTSVTPTTTETLVQSVPSEPQGQVLSAAVFNFTKNLADGSRGADVTALQQYLIDAGYALPSGATGYFGKETRAAVIAFQKRRGIAPVGNVGPLTRVELNKSVVTTTEIPVETVPVAAKSNLSTAQANAILSLVESFGADAAVVAKVKESLGL